MKTKRKPASETCIKIGDLFDDLPDDLNKAGNAMEKNMKAAYTMDCEQLRAFVLKVHRAIWAHLMNSAAHGQGTGPKGPRLPPGLSFVILLPHLVEAKRVLAAKELSFE